MAISDIYDAAFFQFHRVHWRHSYKDIAKWLVNYIPFQSVLDLGCGNGYLLEELLLVGKQIHGIEGSKNALPFIPENVIPFVTIADLCSLGDEKGTDSLDGVSKADLVVCVEVGEHIEEKYAALLVHQICSLTKEWVYFTAAPPGQGGHHHINEQLPEYWVSLFVKEGFGLSYITHALRNTITELPWHSKNALIFKESTAPGSIADVAKDRIPLGALR